MKKTAISVYGLQFGNEGKGATIDRLCATLQPDVVIKMDGTPESVHNVVNDNGVHFPFSQIGSGTLVGIPTHISERFFLDPIKIQQEYSAIFEIDMVPTSITASPNTVIITPYHRFVERFDIGTGAQKTRGSGAITAYEYELDMPAYTIRFEDLEYPSELLDKLKFMANYYGMAQQDLDPSKIADSMVSATSIMQPKKDMDVVSDSNLMIFEHSGGLLKDKLDGVSADFEFYRTVPGNATDYMLFNNAGDFDNHHHITIGCMRAYTARFDGGELYGSLNAENSQVAPEVHNIETEWGGETRVAEFDEPLAKYAIEKSKPNYLSVSHLDDYPWSFYSAERMQEASKVHPKLLNASGLERPAIYRDISKPRQLNMIPQKMGGNWIESRLGVPIAIGSIGPERGNHFISASEIHQAVNKTNISDDLTVGYM